MPVSQIASFSLVMGAEEILGGMFFFVSADDIDGLILSTTEVGEGVDV